jgi:hypothetical protein
MSVIRALSATVAASIVPIVALLAAACTPATTPTITPAPTNTQLPAPTGTPVPSPTPTPTVQVDLPPPDLKVAFIGDQGTNNNAQAVLKLIKEEGAELVVHQGDLAYGRNFALWQPMIDDVLGSSIPYLFSIGNHDIREWDQYQQWFTERLSLIPEAECIGELGINAVCVYKGLSIVLSGVGTSGENHEEYIWEAFATDNHIWRICSWHKNMHKMQSGSMLDETGWGVYEACRENGAMIATAHEHSYSRTYLMASFENQTIASESSTLVIEPGKSFAFVSGLGGRSIRTQDQDWPWMASIFTSDQNADYGALFCTFHVNGMPDHAECYFKDILGRVPDRFTLVSDLSGSRVSRGDRSSSTSVATLPPCSSPLVDAVSSGSTNGSILRIAHTTSGPHRLMLVGVSINNDNFEMVSSIIYGGAPLTLINSVTQADDARAEIWKLVNPPLGNHEVVITFSEDLERQAVAGVVTFNGVEPSDPLGTFAGNSSTGSTANLTVSSAIGELVLSVFSCETCGSIAFLSPAATWWEISAGTGIEIGVGATHQGMSPNVSVRAALENRDHWAMGGISVKPRPNPTTPCGP